MGYRIGADMIYDLRDPIQIGGEDAAAVELLFCASWVDKGQPLPVTQDGDDVPIRNLGRGEKELSVRRMMGGFWGYIKLQFDGGNLVVTKMLKIS